MKVMKAMKKLKFWSRKKRKRKQKLLDDQPHHCHCHYTFPVQPSAPPLPSWLDDLRTHQPSSSSPSGSSSEPPAFQFQTPIFFESSPLLQPRSAADDVGGVSHHQSYQQYLAQPDAAAYGVPIDGLHTTANKAAERSATAGSFGCVVELSRNLVRCFFPCFNVREDHHLRLRS